MRESVKENQHGPREMLGRLDDDTLADIFGVDEADLDELAEDPGAIPEALEQAGYDLDGEEWD